MVQVLPVTLCPEGGAKGLLLENYRRSQISFVLQVYILSPKLSNLYATMGNSHLDLCHLFADNNLFYCFLPYRSNETIVLLVYLLNMLDIGLE